MQGLRRDLGDLGTWKGPEAARQQGQPFASPRLRAGGSSHATPRSYIKALPAPARPFPALAAPGPGHSQEGGAAQR